MKIYKHEGPGHYIGSCIIVLANSYGEAVHMIQEELIKTGLPNEKLDIEEFKIDQPKFIYKHNGDY